MAKEYLDKDGLTYLWQKIKTYVASHSGVTALDIYPVGSIYMSVNAVDPGVLFGGTWEPIEDRFLLAAGDTYNNGATGGEASVTLTAAQSGVPAHQHNVGTLSVSPSGHKIKTNSYALGSGGTSRNIVTSSGSLSSGTVTDGHGISGSVANNTAKNATSAHNNMPPYLVVNMWKRTA